MPERKQKRELEAIWRQKLSEAEEAYGIALANIEKVQAEYKLMPTSDGNFALQQALKFQEMARDEYTRVLQTFTRLVLYGEEQLIRTPYKKLRVHSNVELVREGMRRGLIKL